MISSFWRDPPLIENFIRLMLLSVIFAGLIGEAQQRPPLQGGVSSSQQLDTSPAHISGLMADIYHDVGVVGQALRPSFEDAVNADFSEFDAELKAGSSAAQQYAPCVQQYKNAYAHFVKATDLWVQYSNLRSSASAATLNAILQHMNQELTLGGTPYHAAWNCYQHVPPQQTDVFNSNGGQGGGESNPNPTPARTRKTPWSSRGNDPRHASPKSVNYDRHVAIGRASSKAVRGRLAALALNVSGDPAITE